MHYHITPRPKSEIEIRVELQPEEMRPFEEKAIREIVQGADIEGFRKGKAPADLVRKKIGDFKILERAAVLAVEKTYPEILKELIEKRGKEFEPIGAPKVEFTKLTKGGTVEYKALLALLPQLVLPDYKKLAYAINAEKKNLDVGGKEIEDAILWLRKARASYVAAMRPAEKGDRVEVTFEAKVNGTALPGGKSENHPLIIGEGKFIPGFEDNIIGMKEGEKRNFPLVVPANYAEGVLRGKTIDFSVDMESVQMVILPDITDEFAKGLGNFNSVQDLEKNIREGLRAEKEEKERDRLRIKIADAIAEKTSVDLPALLIKRELDKMLEELRSGVERMALSWPDYLQNIKKNEEVLREGLEKDAARRVKIALLLRKIGNIEKIVPTEEEIQETTNQTLARLGADEEEFRKIDPVRSRTRTHASATSNEIDRETFLEYNTTIARNEKVFRFLEKL